MNDLFQTSAVADTCQPESLSVIHNAEISKKDAELQLVAPKVAFVDNFCTASSSSILVRYLAKLMNQSLSRCPASVSISFFGGCMKRGISTRTATLLRGPLI